MYRIFSFLLMLSPLTCMAQVAVVDSTIAKNAVGKLTAYYANHTQEQAYLHFDKPYYAAGDTIYFKAYVTIGDKHLLSNKSGVLYAELIGPGKQIIKSLQLRMLYGTAAGDFALPDTLTKGNYRVRAYTRWMLNDQSGNYFDRVIPIGSIKANKIPEALPIQPQTANMADVQFFPEGGTLVNDVNTKVAFKAIGSDGLGVAIKGEVVDNQNNLVTTFASAHLGMGWFHIFPEENKTYRAKITYPDGSKTIIKLPVANANGIELAIDNDSLNYAVIKLAASPVFFAANKNKSFTVVIYSGGEVSTFICKQQARQMMFTVAKQNLHTGITYATLFSPAGEPLAERLFFVRHNDLLNLSISSDKPVYAKRGKVSLKLNVKNYTNTPSTGQFSVSVIDENIVPVDENKEHTILTDLLLTDDLKGYVEQPNYYFTNINDKTTGNLDLVMLTHGYRKFQWEKILNNTYPPITLQPEWALDINGIVKHLNGDPLANGTVSLFSLDADTIMNQPTATDGSFHFANLAFMDSSHFILKAVSDKLKNNTNITFMERTHPVPAMADSSLFFVQADVNNPTAAYLENSGALQNDILKYGPVSGILLKEVKVKAQAYASSNIGGAGYADQVIRRGDFRINGGVFSQQFDGHLLGVKFVGAEGDKNAFVSITRSLSNKSQPMLIVLDGVQLPELTIDGSGNPTGFTLDGLIDVNDIETVEVLTSAATESAYGMNGAAGVLVITTRHGNDKDTDQPTTGLLTITPKGFYKAREFYSPKYEHPEATGFVRKDLRSTIYWNPELISDKDGNATFNYYNADGTGSYRVVVEGIDDKGNLGRVVYRYRVE